MFNTARWRTFVGLLVVAPVLALPANSAQRAHNEISGFVRWPDGSPAVGAVVSAAHDVDEELDLGLGFALGIVKDSTDAKGAFRLRRLADQRWKLRAVADALEPSSGAIVRLSFEAEVRDVAVGTKDVTLVLDAGSTISGCVVDDRGEPVAAYEVTLKHVRRFTDGGKPGAWTETTHPIRTEDGRFTIHGVREGACLVGIQDKEHISPEEKRVDLPATAAPFAFTMPRAARIRGLVVDAKGEPVAGALVSVRAPGEDVPSIEPVLDLGFDPDALATDRRKERRAIPGSGVSDEIGRFDIGGIRPGKGVMRADATGHARSVPRDLDLAPATTLEEVRIVLRRGATLRGIVRAPTGAPLEGVDVGVIVDGDAIWQVTGPSGAYRFDHVMPGRVVLYARQESVPGAITQLTPEAIEINVTLHEGEDIEVPIGGPAPDASVRTRVRGTVRGALAVADTNVRFGPSRDGAPYVETRTKGDGSYELELVEKGRYWIVLHLPSDSLAERTVFIAESPEQVVDLELPGTLLRGRVVEANGAAVRAHIRARRTDLESSTGGWSTVNSDNTAKNGSYVFEGLERGPWRLTVSPKSSALPLARRHIVVDLTNSARIEDFVVTLAPGGVIEGVIKGPDGRPFVGARVTARGEDGFDYDHETPSEERVATDAAGRFRLENLALGDWRMRAVADGLASDESAAVRVVSTETARVELALVRGGSVEVRLEDAQGAELRHGPGVWTRIHDSQGRAWHDLEKEQYGVAVRRFGPVPPGLWTVRRGDGARFAPIEVAVKPDEVAQVVLRERP